MVRLGRHVLWDALLTFLPPVLLLLFALFSMSQAAWVSLSAAVAIALVSMALGVLAIEIGRAHV